MLANYAITSLFITGSVVFATCLAGVPEFNAAVDRVIETTIGAALTLGFYLIWPTWERSAAAAAVADGGRGQPPLRGGGAELLAGRRIEPRDDRPRSCRVQADAHRHRGDARPRPRRAGPLRLRPGDRCPRAHAEVLRRTAGARSAAGRDRCTVPTRRGHVRRADRRRLDRSDRRRAFGRRSGRARVAARRLAALHSELEADRSAQVCRRPDGRRNRRCRRGRRSYRRNRPRRRDAGDAGEPNPRAIDAAVGGPA